MPRFGMKRAGFPLAAALLWLSVGAAAQGEAPAAAAAAAAAAPGAACTPQEDASLEMRAQRDKVSLQNHLFGGFRVGKACM